MDLKKFSIIGILLIILLVIGTDVVLNFKPKMHPTMLIEKLIIKTQVQKNTK